MMFSLVGFIYILYKYQLLKNNHENIKIDIVVKLCFKAYMLTDITLEKCCKCLCT